MTRHHYRAGIPGLESTGTAISGFRAPSSFLARPYFSTVSDAMLSSTPSRRISP